MIILGVDPGIARIGWGIVEVQSSTLRLRSGQEFKVQSYGCFETSPKKDYSQRLLEIHEFILGLIEKYKPNALAIEELFFNKNTKTAFVVGQARGVIILAAAQKKITVSVYTPLQVKVAVTGYGKAEKSQVGKMVKAILKLQSIPTPDDTSDALAVALTHAFTRKPVI